MYPNEDCGYEADTEVKRDKKIKNISSLIKLLKF
jgi:hypothetical protein